MLTTVCKWGNSLAIRIPKGVAEDAHLEGGISIDLRVEDGKLVGEPIAPATLESLLAGVTQENLHSDQLGDERRGTEVW